MNLNDFNSSMYETLYLQVLEKVKSLPEELLDTLIEEASCCFLFSY